MVAVETHWQTPDNLKASCASDRLSALVLLSTDRVSCEFVTAATTAWGAAVSANRASTLNSPGSAETLSGAAVGNQVECQSRQSRSIGCSPLAFLSSRGRERCPPKPPQEHLHQPPSNPHGPPLPTSPVNIVPLSLILFSNS